MNKISILNVNDEEAALYAATQILRTAGYDVWEASTGAEALARVKDNPDIVLLDIQLPDIDGLEVCRQIKADPDTSTIIVVHLTANMLKSSDKARALEGGADGYLRSPVTQAELVATIGAFVRIRQAEATQRFLAASSAAMASSLELPPLLETLAKVTVPFLGDRCLVHQLEPHGPVRLAAASPAEAGDRRDRPLGARHDALAIAEKVIRSRTSLLQPCADDEPCFVTVPIVVRDQPFGALTVVSTSAQRRYTRKDVAVVEDLAHRAAASIDNARLYEQAQDAIRTRENLLAIVSHDLKNPLANITLANESNERRVNEDPERFGTFRKEIEIIRRGAARMNRLITDLLDLATVDAGQLSMEVQPVDLATLVQEIAELQLPIAQAKGVALRSEIAGGLPPVLCDKGRILQVLGNLLGNAIKFTEKGGTIELRLQRRGLFAETSVIDDGAGIERAHLGRIFERFWQASRATREGSGLGLSIAKSIVEAHRGRIWAESTLGSGSTFSFTLPFAPAATSERDQ